MSAATRAPGPRPGEMWGLLRDRRRDPLSLHRRLRDAYGGVVHVRLGGLSQFLVSDPEAARHVLVDNAQNYTKGPGYALLAKVMGRGLVTSEGEHWRGHRRVVQPALHRSRLAAFVPVMLSTALEEALELEALAGRRAPGEAEPGATVDVYERMSLLALRIVGRTVLGAEIAAREAEVHGAVAAVLDRTERLSTSGLRVLALLPGGDRLRWIPAVAFALPTPAKRRFDDAIRFLDGVIYDLVVRRRREISGAARARGGSDQPEPTSPDAGPRDLIGLLLRASEEEGAAFTDEDVRDEVMTMFIAGHETVATALTWTLYLLARNPAYQDRIAEEADAVLGAEPSDPPSLDDVARLDTARRVFLEASRLYPAVWRFTRWAVGPDRIAGYAVPAGSVIGVSPYLLHRDPGFWPDPERFDPARFDPGPARERTRGAYLPFALGQRMCPGGSFATVEAQIVLSTLLRRVAFAGGDAEPTFEPRITLRPRGGMPLRVVPARAPSPRATSSPPIP
ncbi:MAG TPA: cytochrome P450 [Longimicrobiales bacterium]|nr:cytochrome P450 [Longimicrobiales bacterium]